MYIRPNPIKKPLVGDRQGALGKQSSGHRRALATSQGSTRSPQPAAGPLLFFILITFLIWESGIPSVKLL